jgi:hypothetical protein
MAFIVRHGLAFLITIFFYRLSTLSRASIVALNLLFVTPLTLFVNETYYFIVAPERVFPFLKIFNNHDDDIKENQFIRKIFHWLNSLGFFFAHGACAISILWVILAAFWTSADNRYKALGKYWAQVMIFSLGSELILLGLQFFSSDYCIKIKIGKLTLFTISNWFYEYCKTEQLEVLKARYCFLCLQVVICTTTGKSLKASDEVQLEKVLEIEPAIILVEDADDSLQESNLNITTSEHIEVIDDEVSEKDGDSMII